MKKLLVVTLLILLAGCSKVHKNRSWFGAPTWQYDCNAKVSVYSYRRPCHDPDKQLKALEKLVNNNKYTCEQLKDKSETELILKELCE